MALTAVAGFAFCNPAYAQETIVDADGDGLIEIDSLEELNNIRYNLEGTSYKTTSDSTVTGDTGGCPGGECKGYELVADLDFDMNNNGPDAADPYYNDGEGWEPIPNGGGFSAIFEGNQHTISNLFIDEKIDNINISIGLFSFVNGGEIRNLGLVNADVTGDSRTMGTLVGWLAGGKVTASYMTGRVIRKTGAQVGNAIGGLIGQIGGESTVTSSYAVTTVLSSNSNTTGGLVGNIANDTFTPANIAINANYAVAAISADLFNVGGLVGQAFLDAFRNQLVTITASYAVATVPSNRSGSGLVGNVTAAHASNRIDITDSYFDMTVSGLTDPPDFGFPGQSKTTTELQMPTGYSGIYANWNVDLNDDGTGDDPWYFGDSMSYPGLSLPRITSGASAGGCPTAPASFPEELLEGPLAGLLDSFTITQLGNRCVHLFGNPALRLKLRVFLESALP